MHKWIAHDTVKDLMICEVCNYVRWPIEKRVKFFKSYGKTRAYIYSRHGYWYLSDSLKTLTNRTSWSTRHDFCRDPDYDAGDYDD